MSQNAAKSKGAPSNSNGKSGPRRSRRRNNVVVAAVPGPNQTEAKQRVPRTNRRLTAAGKAYLRETLNPCGEWEHSSLGIPDGTASETAIVRSREQAVISIPTALNALFPSTSTRNNWYLLLIVPPWIDDAVILVAAGFQPTDFSGFDNIVNNASNYPTWTASETTPALESTVWFAKIPEPAFSLTTTTDDSQIQAADSFRMVSRGVTLELVADDLTNRGRITASQFHIQPEPNVFLTANSGKYVASSSGGETTSGPYVLVHNVHQMYSYIAGNPTPDYLTAANSRTYQGDAKEGVYMPIYKAGEAQPYHSFIPRYIDLVTTYNTAGAPLSQAGALPNKVRTPDQNTGFIWFQGIDAGASVNLKARHTIQAVIPPKSGWAAFSQTSAAEDEVALDTYRRLRNTLRHAYPAAYNDWGLLGNIVKGLVSKIPYVGGILSNLVEPAGKALGGMLGIK